MGGRGFLPKQMHPSSIRPALGAQASGLQTPSSPPALRAREEAKRTAHHSCASPDRLD